MFLASIPRLNGPPPLLVAHFPSTGHRANVDWRTSTGWAHGQVAWPLAVQARGSGGWRVLVSHWSDDASRRTQDSVVPRRYDLI